MRRIVLLAGPVAAALALFACEDSGSGGGTGTFTSEAGTFEAGPPGEGGPPADGAIDAPLSKNVTVSAVLGAGPEPGLTVVFHDGAGAVLETKTTGADGKATSSDGITPVQVSLLLGAGSSRHIITWTAVELGDELLARDEDGTGAVNPGSYSVATQGNFSDGGASSMTASIGDCTSFGGSVSPINIFLGPTCVRAKTAVLARAFGPGEGSNPLLAYAFVKGQAAPATDGGVVAASVGPWLAPSTTKVTPKNVPAGSSTTVTLHEIADGLAILNGTGAGTRIDPATTYLVAPGFADAYQAGTRVFPSSASGATVTIARRAAPAATNDLDFATAPPVLDSATLDTTALAQPSATWTTQGGASLATMDGGGVILSWYDERENRGTWTFVVPPGAKAVKAPTLPKTAEAWLPHGANDAGAASTFQVPTVIFAESDLLPGYAAFRRGVGLIIPLANGYQAEERAILPANGTLKMTSFRQLQR